MDQVARALLPTPHFDTPLYAGTRAEMSLGPAGVSARATLIFFVVLRHCVIEVLDTHLGINARTIRTSLTELSRTGNQNTPFF